MFCDPLGRTCNVSEIKTHETEDPEKLQKYDLPYHVAGLSIVLPDGTEKVVSGVVDEEFIKAYNETV